MQSLSNLLPGASSDAARAAAARPRALTLYIFDRAGTTLYSADWGRTRPVTAGAGSVDDDRKSVFGLLFSLRTLAAAVDPTRPDKAPLGAPFRIGGAASWHRLATDAYALHCLESPTGVRVALATDPGCGDARDVLAGVYALLADTRARHPGVGGRGGREVGPGFGARVDAYLAACGLL